MYETHAGFVACQVVILSCVCAVGGNLYMQSLY